MKKWQLFSAIFQLFVGVAAVAAYVILAVNGEAVGKWTVTLFLAIAYIVLGVIGIVGWIKEKKA